MPVTLIIANQTVGGDALTAAIKQRIGAGQHEFHLLVPMTSPVATMIAVGSTAADAMPMTSLEVPDEQRVAEQRLTKGLLWLTELGARPTGRVITDADTASAVCRVVAELGVGEVIVSTLPTTLSRWLRQDLPRKIERKIDVPVTVVTSKT
jgi:hypothetical protein